MRQSHYLPCTRDILNSLTDSVSGILDCISRALCYVLDSVSDIITHVASHILSAVFGR